jgi:hypothetical protein
MSEKWVAECGLVEECQGHRIFVTNVIGSFDADNREFATAAAMSKHNESANKLAKS